MEPIPSSLAGYQLLCSSPIRVGDLIIPKESLSSDEWLQVDSGSFITGHTTDENGYLAAVHARIYRKGYPPRSGDLDKSPSTGRSYGEDRSVSSSIPDTGSRRSFETGAVRDASVGKGHFHSIPPCARRAVARRYEDGAKKYTKDNWMKGIALSAYVDSINRHLMAIEEGDTTEDHHGALIWNAMAMTWTDMEIQAGRLPKSLDDLPYRTRR